MDLVRIFCLLLLFCFHPSAAASLITGQRVCKAGKGRPCYKLAYFSELRRKLNFAEAELTCRRDGGQLLSIESESEQKVIEQLITELRPTDGDFWIGLRRNHGNEDSSSDCSSQYHWLDGSKSAFRNWHLDEPSCGYEVCVVMYHQPSAPPGQGGLYMFQWNDDNCETKNNFICKYTAEKPLDPTPSTNSTQTDIFPSALPWDPSYHNRSTAAKLVYVIIPTIPLILLLLTVLGVCCFKLLVRRRRKQHKSEVCQTEPGLCPSPTTTDVYNVIRSQKDDDLVSARPQTKNTSFLCSSPDTPTGDYDNLGGRDTESGFVTLASTESGFLNFDLGELNVGRCGTRDFYDSSLSRSGKRELNDSSLGRSGNRELNDSSLGRSGNRELNDSSLGRSGNRELNNSSLGRSGNRELNDSSLGRSGNRELNNSSLGRSGNRELNDSSLGRSGNRELNDSRLSRSGNTELNDSSLGRSGNRELNDSRLSRSENREMNDSSLGHSGKRALNDRSLGRSGNRELNNSSLGRSGNRELNDSSLGRSGNRELNDSRLSRSGNTELNDSSLGRSGNRELNDSRLSRSENREMNDSSLGHSGKRALNDSSLGHSGKRALNDSSLGRSGYRDFYDRSLGRRTTKSELYSSSVYADHGLYDSSIRSGSDLYDAKLKSGGQTGRVDLYQTYITNGKHDTFHTTLGTNRKSFHTNLDCYRNGLNLDSGRRYFNEREWIHGESY